MMKLKCPGCMQDKVIPDDSSDGYMVDCELCAGMKFRLVRDGEKATLEPVHFVSCPECDNTLEVPDGSKPGDTLRCCGVTYRLSFEYDTWSLE